MGQKSIEQFTKEVLGFALIAFDSACFIYHIEENKRYTPLTEILFEVLLPKGRINSVCSTLVLTEVLTRPMVEKRQDLVLAYKSLIASFPHIVLHPFDGAIAESAAFFRAKYDLRTPDAMHIATAYEAGAQAIICNDTKWKKVKEIAVLVLDDYLTKN